jgi:phenylpyruvate tautomerase PptA (4-oxalocrotonate tautomerase family)
LIARAIETARHGPYSTEADTPLARVDIPKGRAPEFRVAVGDVVYAAMTATLDVPIGDRFQVICEHESTHLVIDPHYLGIERTADAVIIQVTLSEGRTADQKKAFYKAIANGLRQRIGFRAEDVFVNLIEVKRENWSLGLGIAQFAP